MYISNYLFTYTVLNIFLVLHLAIRMQKPDLRDFLLSKQECEIDPMDDVAMTPLFYAIDNKDEMGVKGLLNRGASCL